MAFKKNTTPPTFEQRLTAARTAAAAATSVFDGVIADLESAAVDKKALASDIDAEIGRLIGLIDTYQELADEAEQSAEAALAQAQSVRALMGN